MISLSPNPPHFSGSSCLSSLQKVCLFPPALIHLVEEGERQTRREGREDETSRTIDEGGKKEALALINAAAAQRGAQATAINEIGAWWVCRGLSAQLAGT